MTNSLGWSAEHAARWSALAEELRRRLGPGVTLAPAERRILSQELTEDTSNVLVHRSALAGSLAEALGADALESGGHILGRADRLDVTSVSGRALLGHELVHAATSGDSEMRARQVEAGMLRQAAPDLTAGRSLATTIDLEALAERVYERFLGRLIIERERAVGVV
jgi:hypothetical protein